MELEELLTVHLPVLDAAGQRAGRGDGDLEGAAGAVMDAAAGSAG